jgi:CRP/FNR family transcriptional regulator, cyclic AMP receptor protein
VELRHEAEMEVTMVMVWDSAGTAAAHELGALDLFADTDRELLDAVAARCVELDVPAGHELMRAGAEAREFVVILDGIAEIAIAGLPIARLGAGSCLGEMSLVDARRRTADVVARSPMRLIVLSRDDFLLLLERSSSFCVGLLRMVVGRLRLANAQLTERNVAGSGPADSPRPRPAR